MGAETASVQSAVSSAPSDDELVLATLTIADASGLEPPSASSASVCTTTPERALSPEAPNRSTNPRISIPASVPRRSITVEWVWIVSPGRSSLLQLGEGRGDLLAHMRVGEASQGLQRGATAARRAGAGVERLGDALQRIVQGGLSRLA